MQDTVTKYLTVEKKQGIATPKWLAMTVKINYKHKYKYENFLINIYKEVNK